MKKYKIDTKKYKTQFTSLIEEISVEPGLEYDDLHRIMKQHTKDNGQMFSKSEILMAYRELEDANELNLSQTQKQNLLSNVKMKKIRTVSGVTPVTVLTKPFPCPGKCIFCPNDVRMPKSYLVDEPGAQRALSNKFDPYLQTYNRLVAFRNTGHPTAKIELLILGGTWSSYAESYQIWFLKRCFDAMNDFGKSPSTELLSTETEEMPFIEEKLTEIDGKNIQQSYNQVISRARKSSKDLKEVANWEELFKVHKTNETSKTRCIGLVLETRPDEISPEEVIKIRKLGATKVQIGVQSMDDEVLSKNKRGHDVAKTREALNLLRQAGFKIHAHWMPNLYGSTPQKDKDDFLKLFSDDSIKPDELKIYPCSLIASAELMKYHRQGKWKPYTKEELLDVISFGLKNTPRYCRLSRVIRDIPSTDIVVGNKMTNFRQVAEGSVRKKSQVMKDIRAREIKDKNVKLSDLSLNIVEYETVVSKELFLEYITKNDEIAGFLRLSLPKKYAQKTQFINELKDCALIREVHVYGESIDVGKKQSGKAQHIGLGTKLISKAEELTKEAKFNKLAVISSIGTREYYKKFGYELEDLYQIKHL